MDPLDRYMLSEQATEEYVSHCEDIAHILIDKGVKPEEAEDERIAETSDGRLEIYTMIQGVKYSFFVDSENWIVNSERKSIDK